MLGSVLENGAVYYPLLFGIPVAAAIFVAWKRPQRPFWILAAVCFAEMLVDFAFDEKRSGDLPFFVVAGAVLFGLAVLVRRVALRFAPA
jgi:hypothetical protein